MSKTNNFRLEYIRDPGMKPLAVHGVLGGTCAGDALELNLFTETQVYPKDRDLVYDADTGLLLYDSGDKNDTVIYQRKVHTRLIMDKNVARYIIDWLEQGLASMEEESGGNDLHDGNIAKE